jgi:formylglycine-generating enzyme required for sulfatase activity
MRWLLALALSSFLGPTGHSVEARRPLETMIAIAGGTFKMGATTELQAAAIDMCREEIGSRHAGSCVREVVEPEGPAKRVYVSPFAIDRVEVTVAAYRACVRASACGPAPLVMADPRFVAPELPITSVTWSEAVAYCHWRGARLPTEAEWERAARGSDGRAWPWGNVPKPNAFNHGRFNSPDDIGGNPVALVRPDPTDGATFLAPVGSYPDGASREGVLDLAGNAMEWTADVYQIEPPQMSALVNPHGPDAGQQRVLRGGSWRQPPFYARTTYREGSTPETRSAEIGFRCARGS